MQNSPTSAALLIDRDACWLSAAVDEDVALTLIAVASEDPASWDEIAGYWPRYRSPQVPEFADGLTLDRIERAAATDAIVDEVSWVVIDLVQKRITTGPAFPKVGRDQCFAMVEDEKGNQHWPMSVHLPPWWELHEQVAVATLVDQPRQDPIRVPQVNREVLFGSPMIDNLATRILGTITGESWQASGAVDDPDKRYPFTIAVHRDWLMTPRDDLGGKFPRQMLHGGHHWVERLTWSQRIRFDDGAPIVAAPDSVEAYESAPMGLEEMVVYFDLIRELIAAGWFWSTSDEGGRSSIGRDSSEKSIGKLAEFLADIKQDWLSSPLEGGSLPRFIIECSRRRVPRGSGVPIVGISDVQAEEHIPDCDCPLCLMVADGMFGVGFAHLDGHHLELDEEFAFSTCETRQEWNQQQREYAEFAAEMDRKQAEREAAGQPEPDAFASAWSSPMTDEPLPGDPLGQMKMGFLLTEIVGELEKLAAPNAEIKELNRRFRAFRTCEIDELAIHAEQLGEHLETLGDQYRELTSRVADFRSRIDEQVRTTSDNPF